MQTDESTRQKLKRLLHLKRAVRFVWQSAPRWTIANIAIIFVQGVLPLLLLYLMKLVVDSVTIGLEVADKGMAFKEVLFYIVLAGGVTLLYAAANSLSSLVRAHQTQVVADHMHNILHDKSIKVDLEYYESSEYYDKLHRAQQEGPYRPYSIVNGLAQTAQNTVSLLAMAGLLLSFHWGVTAILFIAVFPGVLVQLKYAGKMYNWQRRRTEDIRQTSYFNSMLTWEGYAKEIRLFGLGSLFIDRFHDLRRRLRKEQLDISVRKSLADLAAQSIAAITVFCAYAFIAYRTVQGLITIGDLVMYYGAFQRGLGNLRQVLEGLAKLYEDNLFLSNLYEFLELKPKVTEPQTPCHFPRSIQKGITFDRVSFHYPVNGKKVLRDLSFTISPGETVALVGENGSGKTTLIKLLCRLYDPQHGTISIDGIDIREFNTLELRREISIIFQDYIRYNLTARENIWFGNLDLPSKHKKIFDSAKNAGADGIIDRLQQGYDTILGKRFQSGVDLSIGEWQKVALARAFFRDAQILVLDEPTSVMDAKTEYEVFNRFYRLQNKCTTILISHRFSTIRMADRIIVLDNGMITEFGTHHELMKHGGKYADLFDKQAQNYR
jgi:ATP-binding cassette subfamily B protein